MNIKTILSCIVLLILSIVCKADVLGPFITGYETIYEGYGRVVCVMYNTEYGSGSLVINDEDGSEYTLTAHANGGDPYCYLLKNGTYTVKSIGAQCKLSSNWTLTVGSQFTVNGGQSGYIGITKTAAPKPTITYYYGPVLVTDANYNGYNGYCWTLFAKPGVDETLVLSPAEDKETRLGFHTNYNKKDSNGNVVPNVYYIRPGDYIVRTFSSKKLKWGGNDISDGDVVTISSSSVFQFADE